MASPEFDALMATTQLEREKADGIRSLVAASRHSAKYQYERDIARAALVRIGSIVDEPHAALVVDRVRAALKAGLS